MENLSRQLIPVFWGAIILTGVAAIVLAISLTLLLGTTSHRKVALPLVWIGGAVLAAAATTLALLIFHH